MEKKKRKRKGKGKRKIKESRGKIKIMQRKKNKSLIKSTLIQVKMFIRQVVCGQQGEKDKR
jgi:hypothetical protein